MRVQRERLPGSAREAFVPIRTREPELARSRQWQTEDVIAVCAQCVVAALAEALAAMRWYVRHERVGLAVAVGETEAVVASVKARQAVMHASFVA